MFLKSYKLEEPLAFFINNSAMVVVEEPIYYASFSWPQRGALHKYYMELDALFMESLKK